MKKPPNMEYFREESLRLQIENYELKMDQNEIFIEANEFAILAFKAKAKDDIDGYNAMWKNHIDKKDEAKVFFDKSNLAFENAKTLMKIYDRGNNWIANKSFEFDEVELDK